MSNGPPLELIPPGLSPEQMYRELKCVASAYLARENAGHTLQPTALVHEALLRLANEEARRVGREGEAGWRDSAEFLRFAVVAMQRTLIEHARRKRTLRRGGGWFRQNPSEHRSGESPVIQWPAAEETSLGLDQYGRLDETLARLEVMDDRAAMVVRLRFFAGLTVEECARSLGVSYQTIEADWRFARAFVGRALGWSPD